MQNVNGRRCSWIVAICAKAFVLWILRQNSTTTWIAQRLTRTLNKLFKTNFISSCRCIFRSFAGSFASSSSSSSFSACVFCFCFLLLCITSIDVISFVLYNLSVCYFLPKSKVTFTRRVLSSAKKLSLMYSAFSLWIFDKCNLYVSKWNAFDVCLCNTLWA